MDGFRMLDLPGYQVATRLAALLQSPESRTLNFKRNGRWHRVSCHLR